MLEPKLGENRFATFELEKPVTFEEGIVLHFTLDQKFQDNMHTLGKFRISVTDTMVPVDFGNSKAIIDIVKTPAEERSDEQKAALLKFFNDRDEDLLKKKKALVVAKKPLPEDPKIVALRGDLEDRKLPSPEDPKLARLKRAVSLSDQQLKNSRLTTAQDLSWALINSPAFLFNR